MKIVVQRVKKASVEVNEKTVGKIDQGLLIFIGVAKGDKEEQANFLANKAANLRIFEDEDGKMNLSVQNIGGSILVISQFTLAGDCSQGNRPGFSNAEQPEKAKPLYEYFSNCLREKGIEVANGIFQADMQVSLINDGPATFIIEK